MKSATLIFASSAQEQQLAITFFLMTLGLNPGPSHQATTSPGLFLFFILRQDFTKSLHRPGDTVTSDLLALASQRTRIASIYHHTWLAFTFFKWCYFKWEYKYLSEIFDMPFGQQNLKHHLALKCLLTPALRAEQH